MEQTITEFRIMGIDYGEKRIGIALSDPLLTFAYPYITIQNDLALMNNLSVIIKEKNVSKIILGLPSSRFKASDMLAMKVRNLKNEIESNLNIEVQLWDEEYSSILAEQKIIESVTKKTKRKDKELIDKQSAAIILQEYLDSKK